MIIGYFISVLILSLIIWGGTVFVTISSLFRLKRIWNSSRRKRHTFYSNEGFFFIANIILFIIISIKCIVSVTVFSYPRAEIQTFLLRQISNHDNPITYMDVARMLEWITFIILVNQFLYILIPLSKSSRKESAKTRILCYKASVLFIETCAIISGVSLFIVLYSVPSIETHRGVEFTLKALQGLLYIFLGVLYIGLGRKAERELDFMAEDQGTWYLRRMGRYIRYTSFAHSTMLLGRVVLVSGEIILRILMNSLHYKNQENDHSNSDHDDASTIEEMFIRFIMNLAFNIIFVLTFSIISAFVLPSKSTTYSVSWSSLFSPRSNPSHVFLNDKKSPRLMSESDKYEKFEDQTVE
eukprot:gb/GECH01002857.1/.p1 GENE.gb/GECH01002857.1/~~gb/GECH01002857.1/.p1  ORF type:complete len:354 (+),score=65.82 gb/GECH01002857.1/:1-1062(+)